MRRVEQGEHFTVTRNGAPVAGLVPHRTVGDVRSRFVHVEDAAAGLAALPDWDGDRFGVELLELDHLVDDRDADRWTGR